MVVETMPVEVEIWPPIVIRTGKPFIYLAAHKIAAHLGPEKSLFYACTNWL